MEDSHTQSPRLWLPSWSNSNLQKKLQLLFDLFFEMATLSWERDVEGGARLAVVGERLHCHVAGLGVLTRGVQSRGLTGQAGSSWVCGGRKDWS